ncbi:MAG: hypothetical protein H6772_03700 [Pseudomonadales bacterium]|nr:hypothetical protein [Pseudomonadales bacterium]
MKLFIFKLKLLYYLSLFSFKLILLQAKKGKLVLVGIFLLFLILSLLLLYINIKKISKITPENNVEYSPSRSDLYIKSQKTFEEIQTEVEFWEDVVKKQPHSRDALINLSNLKRLLNENDEANLLWEKAKLIDPNNPLFQK